MRQIIDYENEASYQKSDEDSFDWSDGDRVKLILIENPGLTFDEDFADDTDFTYESDKAEFSGGKVQQKNKRPSDCVLYASFENSANASVGDGTLNSTTGPGASVHDGYLDMTSGNAWLEFPIDNFSAMSGSAGCIRTRRSFTYSGSAPYVQYLIQTSPNVSSRVYLVHNNGYIQCYITNTGGTTVYSMTFAWTPSAGTIYEFEVNWTSTHAYVFINGQLKDSDTGSLGIAAPTLFRLGQGTNPMQKIYEIAVFSSLQHNSNYSPNWSNFYEYDYLESTVEIPEFTYSGIGEIQSIDDATIVESGSPRWITGGLYWDGLDWVTSDGSYSQANDSATLIANLIDYPTEGCGSVIMSIVFTNSNIQACVDDFSLELTGQIYDPSDPWVMNASGVLSDEIIEFLESVSKAGSDDIKHVLNIDGVDYWYDSSWTTSSGYSESNSAAEILANLSSLDLENGKTVKIKSYFHSDDGTTTPELLETSLKYDFAFESDENDMCAVYGDLRDLSDNVMSATGYAYAPKPLQITDESLFADSKEITINDDGQWDVELPQMAHLTTAEKKKGIYIKFTWTDSVTGETMTYTYKKLDIPAQDDAAIGTISQVS